jgi:peptidoglycan/LPS O-acetylase OafA/YrhL
MAEMLTRSPSGHPSLKYRPDIDGLRAVAILAVIAFHLDYGFFSGGYIGVDVFFVISGYLISNLIMRDIADGSFSLLAFYERRVRRIFPALFAMLFVVSIVAWWLLLPGQLVTFEQSLLAAIFSASNFFFWHRAGYFDLGQSYKPLLQTWTLAVEEQFYLLFPPFLLLLKGGSPRRTKLAIVIVTMASFTASLFVVARNLPAAFFFAPLRAWELLLGAILSQRYLPALRSALARHTASIVGLLLVLLPTHYYHPYTPFPGLAALPPCLGAVFIIAAGETGTSIVGRVLSWRPIVFVGLISYSLYLWHWPVIVFQATSHLLVPRAYAGKHITVLILFTVSLVLAVLSWVFVERPFRSRTVCRSRRSIFLTAGFTAAGLSAVAIAIIFLHGFPARYPPAIVKIASYHDEPIQVPWRMDVCLIGSLAEYRQDVCLAQHPAKKSLLLVGDSHAAALYPGLVAALPGYDVLQANFAGCPALLHEPPSRSNNCRQFFHFIFEDFLSRHHVDTLVLAGRWVPADFDALGETVDWTHRRGIQTVVVGNTLEFDAPLPLLLVDALRNGTPENLALPSSANLQARKDAELEDLARNRWHVPYVSFFEEFCHPDCPLYAAPQVPLTFDSQHLTLAGSAMVAEAVRARVQSLDLPPPLTQ